MSKFLKFDASADRAYVTKAFGASHAAVYLEVGYMVPTGAYAAMASGGHAVIASVASAIATDPWGASPNFVQDFNLDSSDGIVLNGIFDEYGSELSHVFTADTPFVLKTLVTHTGGAPYYAVDADTQSDSATGLDHDGIAVGLNTGGGSHPGFRSKVSYIKAGTSDGGSDLFDWDASTGSLADFDVVSGDVTLAEDAVAGLVNLALGSNTLDADPAWVSADGNCTAWTIDRGRQFERDRTQTGVSTVTLVDAAGVYDVLNGLGPNAGTLKPLRQIQIQEINPVTFATETQFTGYIEDWDYTVDDAQKQLTIVLSCVDGFDILANAEGVPNETGSIVYRRQQVDDAQRARLADAGWPLAKTNIFTGNVYVKPVIYQAGTDTLTMLGDCVDSEFVGVSNHWMSRTGDYTFKGRKARFNPSDPSYGITTWNAGDAAGQAGHDDWGRIYDLAWRNAKDKIVNSAIVLPEGVAAADVFGQLVIDLDSKEEFGVRSLKYDGLLNDGNVNTGETGLQDLARVATYYVDNYKQPLPQITRLVFQSVDPDDPTNAGTWAVICGVEISDLINLVTVGPGGGGFNAGFFVEGVHHTADVGTSRFAKRTVILDVSPQALYDTDSFSGDDT